MILPRIPRRNWLADVHETRWKARRVLLTLLLKELRVQVVLATALRRSDQRAIAPDRRRAQQAGHSEAAARLARRCREDLQLSGARPLGAPTRVTFSTADDEELVEAALL